VPFFWPILLVIFLIIALTSLSQKDKIWVLLGKRHTPSRAINLKTAVYPRKIRKTRNKLVRCFNLVIHHLGGGLQLGIPLKFLRASFGYAQDRFCVFRGRNDFSMINEKIMYINRMHRVKFSVA
jgi:hypothetical protein